MEHWLAKRWLGRVLSGLLVVAVCVGTALVGTAMHMNNGLIMVLVVVEILVAAAVVGLFGSKDVPGTSKELELLRVLLSHGEARAGNEPSKRPKGHPEP